MEACGTVGVTVNILQVLLELFGFNWLRLASGSPFIYPIYGLGGLPEGI